MAAANGPKDKSDRHLIAFPLIEYNSQLRQGIEAVEDVFRKGRELVLLKVSVESRDERGNLAASGEGRDSGTVFLQAGGTRYYQTVPSRVDSRDQGTQADAEGVKRAKI